jgi:hypothetical protein
VAGTSEKMRESSATVAKRPRREVAIALFAAICVDSVGLGDRRGFDECKELLESEQWLAL